MPNVLHVKCNKPIGFFDGAAHEAITAQKYTRLDGTHPMPGELIMEHCTQCNEHHLNRNDILLEKC